MTAKRLKAAEKQLNGQVMIAGVADEEKGSTFGVKFLLNKNLVSADYAIIPDIGNRMKKISVAEKGHLVLKITSYGKQAHGSRPADGINAITNMVDFLNLVKNYKMKFEHHKLLSDPTINIGKISGGVAVNVVPGECEVLIDIRYLPSQSSEKIVNDFRKMLSAIKKNKARFGLKITEDQKPTEISEKNPMVKSIIKCSRKFGVNPQISGISGTTVSKLFINKSIPSVGFGPGSDCAHMANEFVEISDLEKFSEILYAVVTDLMC
jgi:acetylornithine deacetylase/succinyl-diaminopimelate desuccinylase-like protein